MRFIYTFPLISEHFWVTTANVDLLVHLFLQQTSTVRTSTIQSPEKEHEWNAPPLSLWESQCVRVCPHVHTCVHTHHRIGEAIDTSITNTTIWRKKHGSYILPLKHLHLLGGGSKIGQRDKKDFLKQAIYKLRPKRQIEKAKGKEKIVFIPWVQGRSLK